MSALVTRHEASTSNDKGRIKTLVPYPYGPGKEALAELEKKFGHARAMEIMEEYANSETPAERVIAWGSGNLLGSTPAAMAREMFDLAAAARGNDHRKSVDPHEHLVISFERSDVVTSEDIERAIQLALAELGMQEHMYAYAAHDDTDNLHAHLIFSRVDPVTLKHVKIEFPVLKAEMIGARINHALGLPPMQGNRYRVNPETDEVELMEQQAVKQPMLFQDILDTSRSWQEFHQRTRTIGINYNKKGSGALINDAKASDVNRAASLSKLVARWGVYEPPSEALLAEIFKLNPTLLTPEAIKAAQQIPTDNDQPKKGKPPQVQRAIDREQARKDLAAKHKSQRDEAYQRIKADKQALRKQMRKIDYRAQQALQMIAADEGKKLMADLRAQQKLERQKLAQFLEQRLPRLDADDDIEPGFIGNLSEDELEQFNAKTPVATLSIKDYDDLARYTAHREMLNGETIYKYCKHFGVIDFVDYGNRINLLSKSDDSVLAALKLAQIKFGEKGIEVNGSEKFKAQVKRLAAQHNIKLAGDMEKEIEIEQVRITKESESIMQTEYKQYNLFKQISDAIGAQFWTPTWTDYDPAHAYQKRDKETGELFFHDDGTPKMRRPGGAYTHKDGVKLSNTNSDKKTSCTPEQVKDLMETIISHQNNRNIGVIVRPYSETHHIVHIDDVTAEKLAQIEADGFKTAVVIKTSDDKRNVLLICDKDQTLDADTNHEIGKALAQQLNRAYGDPRALNETQPFRMPGFLHKKPKYLCVKMSLTVK